MLVSIVIPAFNEESVIDGHIETIVAFARPKPWDFEVIVADDGSTDSTPQRVTAQAEKHPEVRLLRQEQNGGKGLAVRLGMLAARGDVRGFTDADASAPITELDRVLPVIEGGSEVVIGSRAKKGNETAIDAHLHRKIIGRVFNALLRLFVDLRDENGKALADTQCGFKWFTKDATEAIFPQATLDGFAFDVELLYLANRMGIRIAELPINWADLGERSSINFWTDPLKMLLCTMTMPIRHRRVRARPRGSARLGS